MSNLQIQMIPAPWGMKWARSVYEYGSERLDETVIMYPNVYALRSVRDLDSEDDLNEASEWTEVMDCNGKWHRLGEKRVGNGNLVCSTFVGIDVNGWDEDLDEGIDEVNHGVKA